MFHALRYAVGTSLLVALSYASAATQTWQLQGVTFADGAQASGSFTLDDAALGFLQALDINTTAAGSFPAGEYNLANLVGPIGDVVRVNQLDITSPNGFLLLTFSSNLLDCTPVCTVQSVPFGTVYDLDLSGSPTPHSYEYLYNTTQELRAVSAGSVMAVPEAFDHRAVCDRLGWFGLGFAQGQHCNSTEAWKESLTASHQAYASFRTHQTGKQPFILYPVGVDVGDAAHGHLRLVLFFPRNGRSVTHGAWPCTQPPNNALNRSARERRSRVPSSLRSSAPG